MYAPYEQYPDARVNLRIFANVRALSQDHFSEPVDIIVDSGYIKAIVPAGEGKTVASSGLGSPDVVNLGGRFLMPGFTESHCHPISYGINRLRLDLRPSAVSSIEDIKAAVKARLDSQGPGGWVVGTGFDETYLSERRMPTRDDLDQVAPDSPVALIRTCGHMKIVNSAALAASGIEESVADPEGGKFVRDSAGRLTGLVQENAGAMLAVPEGDAAMKEEGFALAQQDFHSWGITTVNDCIAEPENMMVYQRYRNNGNLQVRLRPWLYALPLSGHPGVLDDLIAAGISSGLGDDMLRIQGVKFQLDGSLGGRTAALYDPFIGTEDCGILTHPTRTLVSAFRKAARGGLRMAIHAIGDAAIGQALEALEATGELPWIVSHRNRIEHCSLPTLGQLDTLAEWNLIASSSIGFVYNLGDSYPDAIGEERMARLLPHRDLAERGIVAPGNSDLPVTHGNPWHGVYGAVTRTTRSGRVLDTVQSVSLAHALKMYMADAAYANWEEDRAGVIAPGVFADFQVYDRDPFKLPPESWLSLSPTDVFIAGNRVLG